VARPEFSRTIIEFQHRFPDQAASGEYLFDSRWPEGFRCPRLWQRDRRGVVPAAVVAVLSVPVPGLGDHRHGAAQDPHTDAFVGQGDVPGDDRDDGDPRVAAAASARHPAADEALDRPLSLTRARFDHARRYFCSIVHAVYTDIADATACMVRAGARYEPRQKAVAMIDDLYERFRAVTAALDPVCGA
jgi:hypothetical protein